MGCHCVTRVLYQSLTVVVGRRDYRTQQRLGVCVTGRVWGCVCVFFPQTLKAVEILPSD